MSIIEQKVPSLGESLTEVTIGAWVKKTGDTVELDEIIGEIESDKASFEITAEQAGILEIVAEEGETINVGDTLCKINTVSSGAASAPVSTPETTNTTSAPTENKSTGEIFEMKVTPLGESINEVVLGQWVKEDGDIIELDEFIAEIESDKATFELPAEKPGKLIIVAQEGDTLKIGELICKIEVMELADNSATSAPTASSTTPTSNNDGYAAGHPSPAALKILQEKGIDPKDVKGTGVDGRITKEDALKAEKKAAKPAAAKSAPKEVAAPRQLGNRTQTKKRMSSLRKTIAKRLVAVKNDTAMLTTFNEVNMAPIMAMRKSYKEMFKEKHEVGLGFMSFFSKACAQALLEFPNVNGQIDGTDVIFNEFVDISVAVSTPKGLVVPVIRNVEDLGFAGIEREIVRLAKKARDGKLTIPEMTGGTFTITNGGIFGSMMSTPIINAPQSAILGMHNILQRPMAVNGEVKILPMMYLALSYDHRIIDGKDSVGFLVRVKELLEAPERLLFDV